MNKILMTAVFVAAMAAGSLTPAAASMASPTVMNVNGSKKASKQFSVPYFTRIVIKGSADVVFKQTNGGRPKVTVAGPHHDDVERLTVSSDGKTLTVAEKGTNSGWHFFGSDDVTVYVSAPDLTAVNITGSGDFKSDGKLDTDNLSVVIKGSGDVEMRNVICDNASVQIYGSGDVEIKNLVAQRRADISVKGSGDVDVRFTRTGHVTCSVFGSGDVELKGYVKDLKKQVRGSGEIDTKKLKRW